MEKVVSKRSITRRRRRVPWWSGLLCGVLTCFLLGRSAMGQEADAIISFGVWSIFKDDVACWAASSAEETTTGPATINPEGAMMYVSFFRQQPVPEVSFALGDCCGESVVAHLGEEQADFFLGDEGTYFAAVNERDLLFALLGSGQLALSLKGSTLPVTTFSLEGLKDAYNHLAKICEFKHADFIDGEVT